MCVFVYHKTKSSQMGCSRQLSILPSAGREMSTGQSAVTRCGWGVKARMAHSICGRTRGWQLNCTRTVQPVATCRQSAYVHKPPIVKLLLLIYGFKFRSVFLH